MSPIPDIQALVQVFSNAAAPAFLLGAIAAFMSLISSRATAHTDRLRNYKARNDADAMRDAGYVELLQKRVRLLHSALRLALIAGISTTLLLGLLSGAEFLGLDYAIGGRVLFLAADLSFGAALFRYAQEIWLGMHELDFS